MYFTKYAIRIGLVLAVCALAVVRTSAQQSQKSAGGSVIRGRVVYADTGRPLRRAEVLLVNQDGEYWPVPSITDRNGEFTFTNVNAGKYFVMVNALDIVSPLSAPGGDQSPQLKFALGQIDDGFSEVTVDGRSAVKTEIRVSRGGVITGRVLTETDEPIAKAQIRLFQIEDGKLRPATVTTRLLRQDQAILQTDSRGVYRIGGLATGEYIVRASESDESGNPDDAPEGSYTDGSMMVAFYPKAVRVQDATSVKVQQGSETKDVDIRFTERIGYRISGTVLVKGRPVSSAEIKLTRDEPEVDPNTLTSPQARSDDKGQWEIRTVPDGKYTLLVSGLVIGMVHFSDDQDFAQVAPRRRELIVDGSDVTNINVELVEAGSVRGVVSVEGGTPLLERLVIRLLPNAPAPGTDDQVVDTLANPKGMFSISPVSPGSFHFRFFNLPAGYYVKSITLKGKDLLRNPVKLESGQSLSGVSVVLSSDVVSLSGRVVEKGDRSKPLANATVMLFPVEAERRRISDGPIIVLGNKDGRFIVKTAPGEYFVFVVDRRRKGVPVEMPTETSLVKNASTLQKINLQRGDEKRVVEVLGP